MFHYAFIPMKFKLLLYIILFYLFILLRKLYIYKSNFIFCNKQISCTQFYDHLYTVQYYINFMNAGSEDLKRVGNALCEHCVVCVG